MIARRSSSSSGASTNSPAPSASSENGRARDPAGRVVDHEHVLQRGDRREPIGDQGQAARVGDRAPWHRSRRGRTRAPRPSTTRSTARRPRPAPRTPRRSRPSRGCSPRAARPGRPRRRRGAASDAATARRAAVVRPERQALVALDDEVDVGAEPRSAPSARASSSSASRTPGSARRARLRRRSRTALRGRSAARERDPAAVTAQRLRVGAGARTFGPGLRDPRRHASSRCTTSNDHSSLPVPTGPPFAWPA